MTLNRTGIETADFTWNLYTGCLRGCPFCYARKLARGWLRNLYMTNTCTSYIIPEHADPEDPFFPRFWADRAQDPYEVPRNFKSKNPHLSRGNAVIFAIDMGDIFGSCIPATWTHILMNIIKECNQTFQILTKFPENLLHWWQTHGLPQNVWVGVTVNNQSMVDTALDCLSQIDTAVKYICVEPLQERVVLDLTGIDWMVIGAQTNPLILPEPQWVEELLEEAERHDTQVFLKKSLSWNEKVHQWPHKGNETKKQLFQPERDFQGLITQKLHVRCQNETG